MQNFNENYDNTPDEEDYIERHYDGDSWWGCDICGGNSDSGCNYFDPTECPR